jgi:hypothetical protein
MELTLLNVDIEICNLKRVKRMVRPWILIISVSLSGQPDGVKGQKPKATKIKMRTMAFSILAEAIAVKTAMGTVSVFPGMAPAKVTVAPNSPTAFAQRDHRGQKSLEGEGRVIHRKPSMEKTRGIGQRPHNLERFRPEKPSSIAWPALQ